MFPGELRHINKLRYWPLDAVLHDKYLFPSTDADAIASFLTPMLRLHPDKRAKASELIHHNWLDGVLVQGEVDIIRRAEEEETRRREHASGSQGSLSRSQRRVFPLNQSEEDAMKPVDDVVSQGDVERDSQAQAQPHSHQPPRLSAAPVPSSSGAKENAASRAPAASAPGAAPPPRNPPISSPSHPTSSSKRRS